MTQTTIYFYTGSNGTIQTPIKITGATPDKTQVRLIADIDKILTNGVINTNCIDINAEDISKWGEISQTNIKDK